MKSLKAVHKRKKFFTYKKRSSEVFLQDLHKDLILSAKSIPTIYYPSIEIKEKYVEGAQMKVCNLRRAFRYESKLKYKLDGKCHNYDSTIVKKYLLNLLQRPIHMSKIIPPKQIDGNCWFNSMFMMFFVSDKGRVFFQYLRKLMIEGTTELNDVLALLNFVVECCLQGNPYAVTLNTNRIIKRIHDIIHKIHKNADIPIDIPDTGEAGNPITYYQSLIRFLGNNKLNMIVVSGDWKKELLTYKEIPHVIVVSGIMKRPKRFSFNGHIYELDSASILDNEGDHFCAVLTCNGVEFVFDGYSKIRFSPFQWKDKINENIDWGFKDNIYEFDNELRWNFTKGYSECCYYRKT